MNMDLNPKRTAMKKNHAADVLRGIQRANALARRQAAPYGPGHVAYIQDEEMAKSHLQKG
jgi:hypothetical protein